MESSVDAIGESVGSGENVVIRASGCSVTLLPSFGGKFSSIQVEGHELLHPPLNPYNSRAPQTPFAESDAGGWDECVPSVAACEVPFGPGKAQVPDHGDLWGIPWQVLESGQDSVTVRTQSESMPLELTRSSILVATASGWSLHLLYTLVNVGDVSVPWLWSAHPLLAVDPGDRVVLPAEVSSVHVESSMDEMLIAGQRVSWPLTELADGSSRDLSRALDADSKTGDKLFAGPLTDGWCALERRRLGLRLTLRFEPSIVPYLGLWLCYGGWPERAGAKQVCVAIEPTTAGADSLAAAGESMRWLTPGESVTWPLELSIGRLAEPIAGGGNQA